jgi:DNA repair protein RadC
MSENDRLRIKQWAEEDRPREKLMLKGKGALSNAELLGILIGSGTKSLTAVDIAKNILLAYNNDLNKIARLGVQELKKFAGIGVARAINIVSALELGRRRPEQDADLFKISGSADVYKLMQAELKDLHHEEFWIVLLNRANMVMKKHAISNGGVSGTVADPKMIFKVALDHLASSVVLVHNHPSGNLKPSEADKRLTKQLVSAGALLEISVLDHIIFTDSSYFSFADEQLI